MSKYLLPLILMLPSYNAVADAFEDVIRLQRIIQFEQEKANDENVRVAAMKVKAAEQQRKHADNRPTIDPGDVEDAEQIDDLVIIDDIDFSGIAAKNRSVPEPIDRGCNGLELNKRDCPPQVNNTDLLPLDNSELIKVKEELVKLTVLYNKVRSEPKVCVDTITRTRGYINRHIPFITTFNPINIFPF